MYMAQTKWSGGKTGLEQMPLGNPSMFYIEINREVPNLHVIPSKPYLPNGLYDGTTSDIHETRTLYRIGTLQCWINNVEVSVTEVSSSYFKIDSSVSGYVRVSYLPAYDSVYFSSTPQYADTPIQIWAVPSSRTHIQEIIDALNNISQFLGTKRRRYSINEFNGRPTEGADKLREDSPFMIPVFNEIQDQIVYLYNYAISSLEVGVVTPEYALYNYKTASATRIQQYRSDINALEQAIGI